MSEELRPCPFCKSNNTTLDYYEISGPQELGTIVVCNDCGASAKSIVDWNTRPIEDALNARIAELEAELGKDVDLTIVGLRKELLNAQSRIAELEAKHKVAFGLVRTLRRYCIYAHWYNPDIKDEFNEFDEEVCEYLSEYKEREG